MELLSGCLEKKWSHSTYCSQNTHKIIIKWKKSWYKPDCKTLYQPELVHTALYVKWRNGAQITFCCVCLSIHCKIAKRNCKKCMKSVSHSVLSNSLQHHGLQPTRLLCPWNSPGKNTGVGCYFLLQGIFLTQGIKPRSPALQVVCCIAGRLFIELSHQGRPKTHRWNHIPLHFERSKVIRHWQLHMVWPKQLLIF